VYWILVLNTTHTATYAKVKNMMFGLYLAINNGGLCHTYITTVKTHSP
jgi:hypothetical protein